MSTPKEQADRVLRMRWLALMLNLSRDIRAWESEFRAILELPLDPPTGPV